MRVLAIDFGAKRVGLALGETDSEVAFPMRTLARSGRDKLFADVLAAAAEREVEAIVVGLPLALDGSETLSSRQARNFAASLRRRCELPVELVDERLSTAAALDDLTAAGLKGARLAAAVDQQAAVHILRTYFSQERHNA